MEVVQEFRILAQKLFKKATLVFASHPDVPSGGVSRGTVCGCGC